MNTGKNFLHYLVQAIDQLARAIDQYRAERAASAEEAAPQVQPSQMHRLLRWLTPNGGTLLLVALLILTQNVWARRPAAPTTAISAVATTVNYQGHLADSNGNPLNDTVSLTFAIYDAETGGNVIWGPETHAAVDVQDGLFSVGLGTIQPLSAEVWTGGDRYLEITVDGQTLSPREPIRAVPFAQMAWTVPDGSITTDRIANGAVTSDKLANGAVTSDKLDSTDWIDLPLESGFHSPPNSEWQTAQYRRVGDIVYLRGTITKDSGDIGDSMTLAVLPVGFRPPYKLAFVAEPHDGLTSKHRVDIYPSGIIRVHDTAGSTPHVALDGILFSISP